jgi:hypothetical protein
MAKESLSTINNVEYNGRKERKWMINEERKRE